MSCFGKTLEPRYVIAAPPTNPRFPCPSEWKCCPPLPQERPCPRELTDFPDDECCCCDDFCADRSEKCHSDKCERKKCKNNKDCGDGKCVKGDSSSLGKKLFEIQLLDGKKHKHYKDLKCKYCIKVKDVEHNKEGISKQIKVRKGYDLHFKCKKEEFCVYKDKRMTKQYGYYRGGEYIVPASWENLDLYYGYPTITTSGNIIRFI